MSGVSSRPRIGVVGSCQVIGLGAAFQKMWPDSEVKIWVLGSRNSDSEEEIAAQLARCDLAVSQVATRDPAAPLAFARLQETPARAVYLPTLVFNGFHPDIIYLRVAGALVESPLQGLHSAIITGGYVLGLPEARVARLFNALTYASMGYFDAFTTARDLLLANFGAVGYDLREAIDRWMKRKGPFMHTMNHPGISVLSTLARMAAVRAGIVDADCCEPAGVDDFLARGIVWPVYPELAHKLGLPKSDLVVKLASQTLEREPASLRELPDMLSSFYATYARQDQAALRAAVPARVLAVREQMLAGYNWTTWISAGTHHIE